MIKFDLDKVFEKVAGNRGLPGTRMENYLRDFRQFIEQLASYEEVNITHLRLNPPVESAQERFDFLGRYFGVAIDPEIVSFYQQVDSIQLRWIHKAHPRFDRKRDSRFRKRGFAPGTLEIEMGCARFINTTSLTAFLMEGYELTYLQFKEDEGYKLFLFNNDHHFSGQLAFNLDQKAGELQMYTGDDYFADERKLEIDFPTYMYRLLEIDAEKIESAAKE